MVSQVLFLLCKVEIFFKKFKSFDLRGDFSTTKMTNFCKYYTKLTYFYTSPTIT
jgi:hypothetical protein